MNFQQQRLLHLKNKGFNPRFILDIGACIGEWANMIKSIYPTSDLLLIEANKDNEKYLMQGGFDYKITLLGDKKQEVDFYKIKSGYNTGNSIFIEQTKHYTGNNFETVKLPMETLDGLLEQYWKKLKPNFIKMDVQGAELLILEGGKNSLVECEFILLETQLLEYNKNAPKIKDVVQYMDNIGYQAYDFLDNHYLPNGDLMQVDILFCQKESKFIKNGLLC